MLKVNQLTGFWYSPSDLDFLGGAALILGESAGMGIDFTYHSDITKQVKIRGTGAYYGSAQAKLTYTSPALKLCRQADGVWRYGNHNLCLQSQTFDNATWVGGSSAASNPVITANAGTAPDGTPTADEIVFDALAVGGSASYIIQAFTHPAGVMQFSVWFKAKAAGDVGKSIWIYFAGASKAGSVVNHILTANWVRIETTANDIAANQTILIGAVGSDFGGAQPQAAASAYIWGAQLKRLPVQDAESFTPTTGYLATTSAATYDLPFEWDISGNSLGILVEEQRANACTRSQEFGTSWNTAGITVTSNTTTAPDGTTTADTLDDGVASSDHNLYQQPSQANVAHTFSVFVKPGTGRYIALSISDATNYTHAVFDLTGLVVTQSGATGGTFTHVASNITDAGNGWYRIVLTGVVPNAANFILILPSNAGTYTPDGFGRHSYLGANRTYYVWGAQLEPGSFPTSPIHTVANSITRAPDTILLSTSAYPHNDAAGSFVYTGMSPLAGSAYNYRFLLWTENVISAESHHLYINPAETTVHYDVTDGSAPQAGLTRASAFLGGIVSKIAFAYAANDFVLVANGGTTTVDVGGTTPSPIRLNLSGTFNTNGYIRQITYLARRATDTELQTRTNDGPGASDLLLAEADAMAFDFTYATDVNRQLRIKDLTTPANNFHGAPQAKLTYTSPSIKLTRQSDGVWRYGNHNLIRQSQTFDATWGAGASSITANQTTAPNGTSTADLWTISAGTTTHVINQDINPVIGNPGLYNYQLSCYFKQGTGRYITISYNNGDNGAGGYAVFDLLGVVVTQSASLAPGTLVSSSITSAGGGWYLCSIVANNAGSPNNTYIQISFSHTATYTADTYGRNASAVGTGAETFYLWGAQWKRTPVQEGAGLLSYLPTTTAAAYDLPYEWSAAGVPQGILIEEARTNRVTGSQALSTGWNVDGTTITANNTTAPDGTLTGAKVTETATTNRHIAYQGVSAFGFASSVFLKKGTRRYAFLECAVADGGNVYFDFDTGAVTDANAVGAGGVPTFTVSAEANGWFRISFVFSGTASVNYIIGLSDRPDNTTGSFAFGHPSYLGTTGDFMYVWGVQNEAGAFATSPIHTIAGTVTRVIDQITLATSTFPHSASAGTMVAAAHYPRTITIGSYRFILFLSNGSNSDRQELNIEPSSAGVSFIVSTGGAEQATDIAPAGAVGNAPSSTNFKVAAAWAANDLAAVLDGGTVKTDNTAIMPTVNQLAIGIQWQGGAFPFNGYMRQVTYLKRRASNLELQQKTQP